MSNKPTKCTFFVLLCATLRASTIPYPNRETIAPTNVFTASVTGVINGYFVQGGVASGGGARDIDYVALLNLTTGTFSGWQFQNQTTRPGTAADFGQVNAGDQLLFEIWDTSTNLVFTSDPARNSDKKNHIYATPWNGGTHNGVYIPPGTYIGAEDRTDFNYNDDSFVFNSVGFVTLPESDTALLLLLGIFLVLPRTFKRRRLPSPSSRK